MIQEFRIKYLEIASIVLFVLFIIFGIVLIFHNHSCQNQNSIFEFKCETSLDYEFNCQNKFENITGLYCLDKGYPELKCQNKLK